MTADVGLCLDLPSFRGCPSLDSLERQRIIHGDKAALGSHFWILAQQTPTWATKHGIAKATYLQALQLACTHLTQGIQRQALQNRKWKFLAPEKRLEIHYWPHLSQVILSHCPFCGNDEPKLPIFGTCTSCKREAPLPAGIDASEVRRIALNLRFWYEAEIET